jgi:hypothetical protein
MSFKSVKGHKPRKYNVKEYGDNFDAIFRKDKSQESEKQRQPEGAAVLTFATAHATLLHVDSQ